MKKIILALALGLCFMVMIIVANYLITENAIGKIYSDVSIVPKNNVGLVLGTIKLLKNGEVNSYFKNRIDATYELYSSGKIEFVLVSGDNGNSLYDEPTDMKNELIKMGHESIIIESEYSPVLTALRIFNGIIGNKN